MPRVLRSLNKFDKICVKAAVKIVNLFRVLCFFLFFFFDLHDELGQSSVLKT